MTSCKQQSEIQLNCDIKDKLLSKDQMYRGSPSLQSPFYFVLDSLLKNEGIVEGIEKASSVPDEKYKELHSLAKNISSNRDTKLNQSKVDSLWKLQNRLDYLNTEILIEAIRNTGYENIDTMSSECSYKAFIVFLHTPNELKEEVRKVIVEGKEYLSTNQYNHIMWHLNGRQGNPFDNNN